MTGVARLRSQGYWSILVGVIALLGCLVGVVQLMLYGVVLIRPGHEAVSGTAAVQMLVILGFAGAAFAGFGKYLLYRAHRASRRQVGCPAAR